MILEIKTQCQVKTAEYKIAYFNREGKRVGGRERGRTDLKERPEKTTLTAYEEPENSDFPYCL